ncbi:MAG: IclR family transcriptional regulator [Nisaea sp.]|jgi:DNA-binding IclR family transcriptional regulator|nr:IclR family transcriptional regulator [Nisaea sp.]
MSQDNDLTEDGKDRQFVTALARGLEILRAFQPGDGGLGNQDLAERTKLPKPTVSRLTHTLRTLGYLTFDESTGLYQLGPSVLSLGYSFLANLDIRARARPLMQEMANDVDAAISLGTRDRLTMLYLETCRGDGALTLRLDVGSRIPIAETAMGRAFLAALPEDEREYLMDHIRRKDPDKFPKLKDGIDQAVEDIATRGFTLSLADWHKDVHAVGAPVLLPDRSAIFALNCGGPRFLLSKELLEEELGPRLVHLAETLTMGGQGFRVVAANP